jgi:hypothetical protein
MNFIADVFYDLWIFFFVKIDFSTIKAVSQLFTAHNSPPAQLTAAQFVTHNSPRTIHPAHFAAAQFTTYYSPRKYKNVLDEFLILLD